MLEYRAKSLFISYDGMTDPLGQSQVLPYVFGISNSETCHMTILSCEKKERFKKNEILIRKLCNDNNVNWEPNIFHTQPPILAKYYDLYLLRKKAVELCKIHSFDIIHCRSYLSIEIGLFLKEKFGCKVIFDMRGFWVDERVDGGLWNLKNPFYRFAYSWYKKKENKFIANADHIISLTEAGKIEMTKWDGYNPNVPVTVIPCSADLALFTITSIEQKKEAKRRLKYTDNDFVISYLGSLGTWYLLEEMLDFFREVKKVYFSAKFLFITADNPNKIFAQAKLKQIKETDIQVVFAERKEVPSLMKASDVSLFFIKPAYSKIASSPTKLGELLAMGIPVVCNSKIGDIEAIINRSDAGIIVDEFNEVSYQKAVGRIANLTAKQPIDIRNNIKEYYSLNNAIISYVNVYQSLLV